MSAADLYPVITAAGLDKAVAAQRNGTHVPITRFAVGTGRYAVTDGDGAPLATAQVRSSLQAERLRLPLKDVDAYGDGRSFLAAIVLDEDVSFPITELGGFSDDGQLMFIWSDQTRVLAHKDAGATAVIKFDLCLGGVPTGSVVPQQDTTSPLKLDVSAELITLNRLQLEEAARGVERYFELEPPFPA